MKSESLYSYLFSAIYNWLCDTDVNPRLVVDVHQKGVQVPKEYVSADGFIVISIYQNYTRDLEIGASGISFFTKFKGKEEYVVIPYFAMRSLVCTDLKLEFPLSVWLTTTDVAFRQFMFQDQNNLDEIRNYVEELLSEGIEDDKNYKYLQHGADTAAPESKISFSLEEPESESSESASTKTEKGKSAEKSDSKKKDSDSDNKKEHKDEPRPYKAKPNFTVID